MHVAYSLSDVCCAFCNAGRRPVVVREAQRPKAFNRRRNISSAPLWLHAGKADTDWTDSNSGFPER